MNIDTGREFTFTNPQDDRGLYPTPPEGFRYTYDGRLEAIPLTAPRPDCEKNAFWISRHRSF